MKKVVGLLTTCGLIALAALIAAPLISPPQAEAFDPCMCVGPIAETPVKSDDGLTCNGAKANLTTQLRNLTSCGVEGRCFEELVITMDCFPNGGGGYWVMGKLRYKCWSCF